ncbi:MAG: UDP-glucose 6-dehydrogenase, partial [Chromatiaceae bacterium]|nr:UDP-glucose 6-dehydrogenase [Chromatiaceae bacterium]
SSRRLMEQLWAAGARVRAFDPVAAEEARRLYGDRADLELVENRMAAVEGADALVIVTEWNEFRSPDLSAVQAQLRSPVIFDGRNLFDPVQVNGAGLTYVSVGRVPACIV